MTMFQRRRHRLFFLTTALLILCHIYCYGAISIDDLKNVNTRFYIYDEYEISHELTISLKRLRRDAELSRTCSHLDHILRNAEAERIMMEALEKHPLRTRDPNEAELYIVPTLISELFAYDCQDETCTSYDKSFDTLRHHQLFQKTHGSNHVLLSHGSYFFNSKYASYVPALARHYKLLANVTVASYFDPSLLGDMRPITKGFSTGLGMDAPFDIQEPTLEKYNNSKYVLFYHRNTSIPDEPFTLPSLPELDRTIRLEPISLENNLPPKEWQRRLLSSKFCLFLSGDPPHSNPLLYAIRAGCIPVIVDDNSFYQDSFGPFPSSLNMEDFSILIKHDDFVKDPDKAISNLNKYYSKKDLERKLQNLAVAQSIVFPDHPHSLFVQSLIREAMTVEKHMTAERHEAIEMGQGRAVVSSKTFTYRYPTWMKRNNNNNNSDHLKIIFGVLSNAATPNTRHSIRNTWAATTDHHVVLFIVSGLWEEIKDEFYEYGDLLWIDMMEDYLLLTFKTQIFFQAVDTILQHDDDDYDYVFKTDDDSYIGVQEISRILSKHKPEYWGKCMSEKARLVKRDTSYSWFTSRRLYPQRSFPPYASGCGYALSRDVVTCAVSKMADLDYLPWEDAATGLLARACNVSCRSEEKFEGVLEEGDSPPDETNKRTVAHYVMSNADRYQIHLEELEKMER